MSNPQHPTPPPPTIPDAPHTSADDNADETLPLPLSASLVLTSLPQDAHLALELAAEEAAGGGGKGGIPEKVLIRFSPVGSAPALRPTVFKVSSRNKFSYIVIPGEKTGGSNGGRGGGGPNNNNNNNKPEGGAGAAMQVFCYVNSVFAPGLDEGVGGLWKCFKTDDTLLVAYSTTPAFG